MILLNCTNLTKQLTERILWKGINLSLLAQQQLALTGPSGSGKTVLLWVLAGLEPANEGEICFLNKPLSGFSMPQYRAQVIYLHQRTTVFEGTVEDNLRQPFSMAVHKARAFYQNKVLSCFEHQPM